MSIELTRTEREILRALDGRGGYLTRQIAKHVTYCDHNNRMRSGAVRAHLINLKDRGLVKLLDNDKPSCWGITAKGSEAVLEDRRISDEYAAIHCADR